VFSSIAPKSRELKTARGHMMPPPVHICNGLARPADIGTDSVILEKNTLCRAWLNLEA